MADELVPNPDGCTRFDPNPFKKEKCKTCSHSWEKHKGVITDEQVSGYLKARQDAIDKKDKAEAEAKASARAKVLAKKKANQAVEDEWFFDEGDGTPNGGIVDADSDDDDIGFRMFSAGDLEGAGIDVAARNSTSSNKAFKVKNLIDFSECDVPEEDFIPASSSASGAAPEPAVASLSRPSETQVAIASPVPSSALLDGGSQAALLQAGQSLQSLPSFATGTSETFSNEAALLSEIEHLRQQLSDTQEEKNLQVAIFKDEIADRQKHIEELKRQAQSSSAVAAPAVPVVQAPPVDVEALVAARTVEVEKHREAALTELAASKQEIEAARKAAATERDRLSAEAEKQRLEIQELSGQLAEQSRALVAKSAEAASLAQRQESQVAPVQQEVISEATTALLTELRKLCVHTRRTLVDEAVVETAVEDRVGDSSQSIDKQLSELRDMASAAQSAAERQASEKRHLLAKLQSSNMASRAITDENASTNTTASADEVRAADRAAAQLVSRHAAQALREVRLNAERQLSWITKRMQNSEVR